MAKFESRGDAWLTMDDNKDARISPMEFRLFVNEMFQFDNPEVVDSLFCEIDGNRNGYISLDEFKAHVQDHINLQAQTFNMGNFSRLHSSPELIPSPAKEEPSLGKVSPRRYSLGDESLSDEQPHVAFKRSKERKSTKAPLKHQST